MPHTYELITTTSAFSIVSMLFADLSIFVSFEWELWFTSTRSCGANFRISSDHLRIGRENHIRRTLH